MRSKSIDGFPLTPNTETVYEFVTKVPSLTNGLMQQNKQRQTQQAGQSTSIQLKANVRVQSFPDHTMRFKMGDIKFYIMDEESRAMMDAKFMMDGSRSLETRNIMPRAVIHNDLQMLRYLEDPVIVFMKGDVIKKMIVSRGEPKDVTSLKKSVITELKLNGSSSHLRILKTSLISMPFQTPILPNEINM